MDRQDLKAQLTKTQELLSIAIKEKDTADMILEAPSGVFFFDFFFGRKGLRSKNVAGGDRRSPPPKTHIAPERLNSIQSFLGKTLSARANAERQNFYTSS